MVAAEEPATNGGRILAWSFVALALILELNAVLKGTLQAAGLNFDFVLVAAAGLGALGVVAALARPSTLGGLRVVAPPLAAFVAYMALSATWSDGYFVELPDAFVRVFGPQIGFPVFKILDFTAGCVVPLVGAAVVTAAAPRAGAYLFLAYGAIVVALLPYLVGHVVATEEVITETGVAIGVVQGVSYIQFGLYVGKMIVAAMVAVLTLRLGPVLAAPARCSRRAGTISSSSRDRPR
ncbi:MAG: hypothetical protein IPK81_16275 [Rhodospirillales bacterium]|nr:MAG: hypothetical protein IPK81_16275 [Rhodospirillales bacterium]